MMKKAADRELRQFIKLSGEGELLCFGTMWLAYMENEALRKDASILTEIVVKVLDDYDLS